MRFLLVMLAVAASMVPLLACEATKASQNDASAPGNTKALAPAALETGERHAQRGGSEGDRAEGPRSESLQPRAVQAEAVQAASSRTVEAQGIDVAAKDVAASNVVVSDVPTNDIAAKGNHPPASGDERGIDEGNGEPMDDVDDEEIPATDKSGVDHPRPVDEESEGAGIKLQD